jgi:hypothetical protein
LQILQPSIDEITVDDETTLTPVILAKPISTTALLDIVLTHAPLNCGLLLHSSQLNNQCRHIAQFHWRTYFYQLLGSQHRSTVDTDYTAVTIGLESILQREGMVESPCEEAFWEFVCSDPLLKESARLLCQENSLMLYERWGQTCDYNDFLELGELELAEMMFRGIGSLDHGILDVAYMPENIYCWNALTELCFAGTKMEFVPGCISLAESLSQLDLRFNSLTSLTSLVGSLLNLKFLDLGHNQLSSLPDSISKLACLTKLYVDFNPLGSFPPCIRGLKRLNYLNLDNCEISTVPAWIGEMCTLTRLILTGNLLQLLPEAIFNLKSLIGLHLDKNQLTTISPNIKKLSSLLQLKIHKNRLKNLPVSICAMASLEHLAIHGNPLNKTWTRRAIINPLESKTPPCVVVS